MRIAADGISRREFLGRAAGTGLVILKPNLLRGTSANSAIRVGLLGCGRRGGAVTTAMVKNNNARVLALADLFEDKLILGKKKYDALNASKGYGEIDQTQMFRGPKAYEQIAASKEVDAVIIATPSYFHPEHLDAVVTAGKHVYCEKPAGIDVPATLRFLKAAEKAKGKLSLAVGLEVRYASVFAEIVRRIQGGAIGEIACGEGYYFAPPLNLPSWPNASPAERKIRNFFYYTDMSGGILVDQSIHILDVISWSLKAHPVKAMGTGGRKVRQGEGDCWDHYNLTYTYPNSVHVTYSSTQFDKGWWDVCSRLFGSKGVSEVHYSGPVEIYGDEPWKIASSDQPSSFSLSGAFLSNLKDADTAKTTAFINSIATGQYLNEAPMGVEATWTTILGSMAASTGREVTWEEMLRSKEVLNPGIDLNQFA